MKKVARLRVAQSDEGGNAGGTEHVGVRTTGRIKKPKAVFDPSDNYLPRSQRANIITPTSGTSASAAGTSVLLERKKDTTTSQQVAQQGQENKRVTQSSTASSTTTTAPAKAKTEATAAPSAESTATTDVCDVCQKGEAKRGTHAKNKLISCLDCERRVHKLCLPVDFEDIDALRQNYRCDSCRTCDVCDAFTDCEPKINQPMVTCSKCIKSYHLTCHIPNVFKFQQIVRWKCNKCVPILNNGGIVMPVKTIREIIGDEPKRTSTPQQQQQQPSPPEQEQQQQVQNVNIAAAAEEAKNAAAAAKRSVQDAKSNNKAPQKAANGSGGGGGGGGAETDVESAGGSSTSSSSGSSNSDSSSSTTSSTNTRRSVEGRGVDDAPPVPKKQKTNNEEIAVNHVNTHTPVIRYSPYEPIDVPDVKDWTVEQVASYFAKYFPNEAHVFKEHEIDGTSLLLLKRSDVIKKLPIKLGPSLRIYSLILKIQTQLNDPTLGWNCGL